MAASPLQSALNQPLRARIELVNLGSAVASDFRIHLASNDAFAQAGVDRPQFLDDLVFTPHLRTAAGSYIEVASRRPLNEPYLGFIVQLEQPGGRQLREFTLLVDPPRDAASASTVAPTPVPRPSERSVSATRPATAMAVRPVRPAKPDLPPTPGLMAGQGTYLVKQGDTLWSIARRLGPGGSRSAEQLLVDLVALNPGLFGARRSLQVGQVLRLPAGVGEPAADRMSPRPSSPPAPNPGREPAPPVTSAPTLDSPPAVAAAQAPEEGGKPLLVTQDLGRQVGNLEEQLTQLQSRYDAVLAQKEDRIVELEDQLARMQHQIQQLQATRAPGSAPGASAQAPANHTSAEGGWFGLGTLLLAGAGGLVLLALLAWRRRDRERQARVADQVEATTSPQLAPLPDPVVAALAPSAPVAPAPAKPMAATAPQDDDHAGRAEIYLAYGRYGQARDVLVAGLREDGSRQDLRLTLLRVLATLGAAQEFAEEERLYLGLGGDPATLAALPAQFPGLAHAIERAQAEPPVPEEPAPAPSDWAPELHAHGPAEPAPVTEEHFDLDLDDLSFDEAIALTAELDAEHGWKETPPSAEPPQDDLPYSLGELPAVHELELDLDEHFFTDELERRFDEAQTLVAQGDVRQATALLQQVARHGSEAQRDRAQTLLMGLA